MPDSAVGLLLEEPPSESTATVRIASTQIEKEEIYRLRYQVYIEEMGGERRHVEADCTRRVLRDHWDDSAHHFYIHRDGVMVAAGRLNVRCEDALECEEQFEIERFKPFYPNQVCMTSRVVVHPQMRGSHLLKSLTCAMYRFGRKHDMRFNFIDCHSQWLPLYSRLGYRLYRPGFNHDKYTYVIPMVLVGDDLDYLKRVRSPFVPIARRYRSSVRGRELLFSQFPYASHSHTKTLAGDLSSLSSRLSNAKDPTASADLLRGMTINETKQLLSLGHLLYCRPGDEVLTAKDAGRELFLILQGSFQVRKRGGAASNQVLKILAAGESFGESRFLREDLRPALITAREEATLLVLNARSLDRLVMHSPKMAAKLFRNIARIVASRECDTVRFMRFGKLRHSQTVPYSHRPSWHR
jgi:predicted GNAT family N-acyltransferase